MANIELELPQVYLQPGEVHLARSPSILKTVLGSCVGVSFWSPRLVIGALCHGILPQCPEGTTDEVEGYRYVDFAITDLVHKFARLGATALELQIKVFGGADVLPVVRESRTRRTVGRHNLDIAMEVIEREGLIVAASDIGGTFGRSIQLHTGTGKILLRRLARLSDYHSTTGPGEG